MTPWGKTNLTLIPPFYRLTCNISSDGISCLCLQTNEMLSSSRIQRCWQVQIYLRSFQSRIQCTSKWFSMTYVILLELASKKSKTLHAKVVLDVLNMLLLANMLFSVIRSQSWLKLTAHVISICLRSMISNSLFK